MSEIETGGQEPQFAAFVGIDWADQKHVWCLQSRDSTKREIGELKHTPEAVEAWVAQLCQRFGNRPIAVALEQSRGSLVFMLAKYEPLHLFPVPSTMSASMRKALYPSGSKDDPRDADVLLDLLLLHRNKLRRLSPDTEATRRIQNLVEERRKLVDEKTEHTNRLTSHLKIYFPQMLNWFEHLDTELVCALLERWPTLEELQRVPPAKPADVLWQALLSRSRAYRVAHTGDSSVHSRDSRSGIDRSQECRCESDCAAHPNLARRYCGFGREDRGGGGRASRFFHL